MWAVLISYDLLWANGPQIEEVKGVNQVLDQEEEIAMKEFARFEEKLRQQKGPEAVASTVGKSSLDYAEGWRFRSTRGVTVVAFAFRIKRIWGCERYRARLAICLATPHIF
jgi:hypothetical protein